LLFGICCFPTRKITGFSTNAANPQSFFGSQRPRAAPVKGQGAACGGGVVKK
jgi:hypothetical protein